MANNPIKPPVITPKQRYQTNDNDNVAWKDENKMATKFYNLNRTPPKSPDTSGSRSYGDAEIDIFNGQFIKKNK